MSHAPKYRTIVADPPWDIGRTGLGFGRNGNSKRWEPGPMRTTAAPYSTMSLAEIAAIPVSELVEREAHLYLWTTQKFLWDAPAICNAWGFKPATVLVWCKEPRGFNMGGTYASTTEFCVFARRGSCAAKKRVQRQWFTWPRPGGTTGYGKRLTGPHSQKPEAFLDLVEQVSPGPYLEMFARRQRLGWDTWGNEALEHVELAVGGDPE